MGTDPDDPDTDDDTYPDGVEYAGGSDPLDGDVVPLGLMYWPEDEPIPRIGVQAQPELADSEEFPVWVVGVALAVVVAVGSSILIRRRSDGSNS